MSMTRPVSDFTKPRTVYFSTIRVRFTCLPVSIFKTMKVEVIFRKTRALAIYNGQLITKQWFLTGLDNRLLNFSISTVMTP